MFDPTRHVRPNTLDFKPPMPNPLVQGVFRGILPLINGKLLGGLSVEIDPASLEKLRAIKGQRCLLLPNHPSEWDPCVMFEVGRRLNENFFFVAAREVFDYSYGMRGWFFQRLGVYSLVRGSNDRKSLKTSMEILSENKGRLVIFVEGEISQQNETLLPLEEGVVQLAFMALNDFYKQGGKKPENLPSMFICPVSLRYAYQREGLDAAIENAIKRLEEAAAITEKPGSRFERLRMVSAAVLKDAAGQIGCELAAEMTMAESVSCLSDRMLTKLEQVINLGRDESLTYLDRVRRIRNKVDAVLIQAEDDEASPYQKRLHAEQKAVLKNFYRSLDRVVNFVAIYDGYLQPDMDETRYVELIRRLEKEVFGAFQLLHPRTGHVVINDPIDLKDYFQDFLADKKTVVHRITRDIEQKMYNGIMAGKEAPRLSSVASAS